MVEKGCRFFFCGKMEPFFTKSLRPMNSAHCDRISRVFQVLLSHRSIDLINGLLILFSVDSENQRIPLGNYMSADNSGVSISSNYWIQLITYRDSNYKASFQRTTDHEKISYALENVRWVLDWHCDSKGTRLACRRRCCEDWTVAVLLAQIHGCHTFAGSKPKCEPSVRIRECRSN